MAKLTTKQRKALKPSQFALSGRRFPVNNESHARAALSGASRALHAGTITSREAAIVRDRAHAMLSHHYH